MKNRVKPEYVKANNKQDYGKLSEEIFGAYKKDKKTRVEIQNDENP